MPLFIIITGYFSHFNRKKLLCEYIYVYVLFQILYIIFNKMYIKQTVYDHIQFTTPYWIMWYLFAIIVFHTTIPLFDTDCAKKQITLFCLCFFSSLILLFDNSIGHFLSFSRIVYFYPFFVFGHYASKHKTNHTLSAKVLCLLTILLFFGSYYICNLTSVNRDSLYGFYPYDLGDYNPIIKIILTVLDIAAFFVLINIVPNKKLPVITAIGQNTLPIYLLHGFVILIIQENDLLHYSTVVNLVISIILSFILMAAFGNQYTSKIFDIICTGKWIEKNNKRN